ncbi:hypothetical protein CEUSTIGMA_g580.t1 [Chlamydomonas eustigma]|uniref:Fe2OG dioxygenase domain-containing protein n=1 Tax=Chlamydomonas eustigma TaxID=1157962 RepID=A0A250WQK8_9CHLO|nr:hypothetical protein CEUSTIGMA_g580.t1 [Chlamydomonas eustigma]|eukprot:GAX73127.1 hypothetical protein CEUSTIGMA_g580.t1 [Chlamydomonas eustigma]
MSSSRHSYFVIWRFVISNFWIFVCITAGEHQYLKTSEVGGDSPRNHTNTHISLPHTHFDESTSPWVEQVGEAPKVYYFHNFLTDTERQHMIKLAVPYMKRSTVVGGEKGAGVIDDIRTSYGMFIRRLQDPVLEGIEKRISLWTHLPLSHQEDIQVLRYQEGQTYGAHYDSSYDKDEFGPKYRLATLLIYLSDVEEGGETAFPKDSIYTDPSIPVRGAPWSDCAKGHVAVKPKKNDAVLFYSYFPNGTMDPASMHTGCPVIKGIKWAAPIWIHVDQFRPEELKNMEVVKKGQPPDPGVCDDYHAECSNWASNGQCLHNQKFMLDVCRKSCKECEHCALFDLPCVNRNRAQGGYLPIDREEMKSLGVDLWQQPEPSPEL